MNYKSLYMENDYNNLNNLYDPVKNKNNDKVDDWSISSEDDLNRTNNKINYPKISDDDFYSKINRIYKKFTIPKKKKTFKQICFPKQYELQLPQKFMAEYLSPSTPYKGVLVYHRIGAGKTCTAIRIAEEWKNVRKIIIVLPASLKGNFRGELRSLCAGNNYLTQGERKKLSSLDPSSEEYIDIIKKSDERIDDVYTIYSYNKFIELTQTDKIKLRNTILIIDEIQNMVSEEGTYYTTLLDLIDRSPNDLRIVLLSATPMFDKPNEIALTMNLLRIPTPLPTGKEFYNTFVETKKNRNGTYYHEVKNLDLFKEAIKGYVSYFRGAPPYVFPQLYIKYVRCNMSEFQYKAYKDVLKNEQKDFDKNYKKIVSSKETALKSLSVKNLPNNFFIGTRVVSNIVFPNRKINEEGFDSFKGKRLRENLEEYSIKFFKIIKKISKTKGKVFIYSGFKEFGGIRSFTRVLDAYGWKNYTVDGSGPKRYAVWSGDEDTKTKDEIKAVYNNKNNLYGKKLKVLLGSPSIKEGVSLTAVRQVHILEPYWNQARLDQVIGRASRYCSHKDLPEEERVVNVYIYVSVHEADKNDDNNDEEKIETVDEYIQQLSEQKNKLVKEFERAIKESAVDCTINKVANESDIKCVI